MRKCVALGNRKEKAKRQRFLRLVLLLVLLAPKLTLKEPHDAVVFQIQVHVIETRARGEARHHHDVAANAHQETRPNGRPHFPHLDGEPRRDSFRGGVGGQGKLGLGHAYGEVCETRDLRRLDLDLGFRRIFHPGRTVAGGHRGDLVLDGLVQRVQELELRTWVGPLLVADPHHLLGEVGRAFPSLCPMVGHHGGISPRAHGSLTHHVNFGRGVGEKLVDSHHHLGELGLGEKGMLERMTEWMNRLMRTRGDTVRLGTKVGNIYMKERRVVLGRKKGQRITITRQWYLFLS